MSQDSVSAGSRVTGWLVSLVIFATVLALSGRLPQVLAQGGPAAALVLAIALVGELLARFNTGGARPVPRREEMRALIGPFYATLQRRVRAEAEAPEAGSKEYEFDAATARVVEDEEAAGVDESGRFVYELKRYARSPEGEYFWMILQVAEGAPRLVYIKHVAHNVARYALKEKYLPPPAQFD